MKIQYGYLIGEEFPKNMLQEGKYISGSREVFGRHETTLDLILSVQGQDGGKTPLKLVTASRDYLNPMDQVNPSARPHVRITTYHLICKNQQAGKPENRMFRIGGYTGPQFLSEGPEYESIMSRLRTEDFVAQLEESI